MAAERCAMRLVAPTSEDPASYDYRSRLTLPGPARTPSSILFERYLAVVLSQEIQKPFVIALLHVEDARHDLVVPASFLQAQGDQIADVRPCDLAPHEHRIHRRPERLALLGHSFVQRVGDRAAPFPFRSQRD